MENNYGGVKESPKAEKDYVKGEIIDTITPLHDGQAGQGDDIEGGSPLGDRTPDGKMVKVEPNASLSFSCWKHRPLRCATCSLSLETAPLFPF